MYCRSTTEIIMSIYRALSASASILIWNISGGARHILLHACGIGNVACEHIFARNRSRGKCHRRYSLLFCVKTHALLYINLAVKYPAEIFYCNLAELTHAPNAIRPALHQKSPANAVRGRPVQPVTLLWLGIKSSAKREARPNRAIKSH